jgi:homocysteine S-methyltransferase
MTQRDFLKELSQRIILFDGAMGTRLYEKGIFINRCFDELNISSPRLVKEIHQEYIEAGADILETNTFGANKYKLKKHGFMEELNAINYQGAVLAKETAGEDIFVAGSIGPLGIKIEPWGPTSEEEAREAFQEQAHALDAGGVDVFILETFYDLHEIQQALQAVREISDKPVIAQMTIADDGNSLYGTSPELFTRRLDEWGADVIGVNCSVGPQVMLTAVEKMAKVTSKPISVQPNAGVPREVEGRNIYLASAEYMAEYARRFIQAGAKVVGGCCGTTPEHIRMIHKYILSIQPRKKKTRVVVKLPESPPVEPIPREEKSMFARKICQKKFVTTIEIVPPRGIQLQKTLNTVKKLKDAGTDAVNIPDGPRAMSRMGASFLSLMIEQKVGIETILHYTCRDRNLLGMMSDFLGIYASGIKNVLIITGDPPKMGDYPDATAVFDVDSIGLVNMVNRLNQGVDLGGNPIGEPTGYHIGVGVNPGAVDLDYELRRFYWKVDAGAEFAITQPVFDIDIFYRFLKHIEEFKIPIIAGIWPLVSLRNAEFMNNEVPGAHVPDLIMKRMRNANSREEALEVGMSIARETARELQSTVAGVQVAMPFGNVKYPLAVLEEILS